MWSEWPYLLKVIDFNLDSNLESFILIAHFRLTPFEKLGIWLRLDFTITINVNIMNRVRSLLSFLRAVSWREEGKDLSEILEGGRKRSDLQNVRNSPWQTSHTPRDTANKLQNTPKIACLRYPNTSWEVLAAFSLPLSSSTDEPQHLQRRGLNAIQKRRRWQGKPNLRHESAHLRYPDLWMEENRFRLGVWAGIDWDYNIWKGQWILPEKFGAMLVKVGKKAKNWASCGIVVCIQ